MNLKFEPYFRMNVLRYLILRGGTIPLSRYHARELLSEVTAYKEWRVMGKVIQFQRPNKGSQKKVLGVCECGFHCWTIWQGKQYDAQHCRLITVYRCNSCGAEKVKTH